MSTDTQQFRMADRLAEGNLSALLVQYRTEEGRSLEEIVRRLYAEYGIEVTRQTLDKWCRSLGIEKSAA